MAKFSVEEFISAIKEMSVLELNELVKAIEEEFGVSAAAPVAVAGVAVAFLGYLRDEQMKKVTVVADGGAEDDGI